MLASCGAISLPQRENRGTKKGVRQGFGQIVSFTGEWQLGEGE